MILCSQKSKKCTSLVLGIFRNYIKEKHFVNDLAFLRHAQSVYNVQSSRYIKKNNITDLKWDQICEIEDYNLDINFNKKFIDCDLSSRGAAQCFRQRDEFESTRFDYDLILVSPLTRALRTCRYIFQSYPIKKIVLPELTEAFRYSCDVSMSIDEKRQQFKEYDFSRFQKNDDCWILGTQSKETAHKIIDNMANKQLTEYPEVQKELVMMMNQGKLYQSDYHLRLRTQKVKRIIESYKQQYRKVLVISHHYMIQNLLAQGFRKNHKPIISTVDEIPNTVPMKASLRQIMTII